MTVNFNNVSVRNDGDLDKVVQVVKDTLKADSKFQRAGINI